jgi:large subunit ribosomal protein L14
MIQLRSILEIADNTGARRAAMISKKGQITDTAGIGDVITVHIKQSSTDATVKKGEVHKAVVVRTKAPVRRADGSYLRFDSNAIVIIDATNNPKGTRIFGPIARELRAKNFSKIISLAPEVL